MTDDTPLDPVVLASPAPAPPPPPKAPAETPGSLIRAARERAQLSLDELAGQTKLARTSLDALERDDFAALLEPVYVRGYYRKVAKVLGIPEAPLMKAYEMRVVPRVQTPPAKLRLGTGIDVDNGRRLGGVLVVAVFAVLVGIIIWYLRGERASQGSTSLPAQSAMTGSAETPPEAPIAEPTQPAPQQLSSSPAEAPAAAQPATTASQPSQTGTAAATGSQLQLNFVSNSWARVKDANGRELLNRVVQAGERQVLDGVPPYAVFLGNAPAVEVQYMNAAVDIKPLTRDNATARFTVPLAQP